MSEMMQRQISRTDIAANNPWQSLVKEFDPDNSMGDGRSYVGKASHLLDRPAASRGGRGGYSGYSGPTREQSKASPAVSPQRPRPPPSFQAQRQAQLAPRGPPSFRPQSKNRWSGQSLATANSLPPGFFATAKPRGPVTGPASEPLTPDRQTPVRPRPPPATQTSPSRVFKGPSQAGPPQTLPTPTPSSRGPHEVKQAQTSASTLPLGPVQVQQDQPPTARSPELSTPAAGRLPLELKRSSSTFTWGAGSVATNKARLRSESLIDLTEDETMTIYSTGSEQEPLARPSISRQGFSNDIRNRVSNSHNELPSGDPVVFQYPLADGHWATLALYVDRDARSAQSRFSDIRTRQMSDIKKKSPEDVGKIVARVIQETVDEDK
ncbi:hypothetical protein EMPS_07384 [Entomortierella parvispora]|uniref:Uncharacterized protein n=1 Tax=Entomortierella parvispora TaxID=205924 RepID=A0A9P3LY42_9FUNG|nr:hypothetical protein EMPS_07384 [Entomortierella parvispora]